MSSIKKDEFHKTYYEEEIFQMKMKMVLTYLDHKKQQSQIPIYRINFYRLD